MKILAIHPYGIGDVLFMTPLLRAIRKQLSVEYIDVIIGSRTKEVLENNPDINGLFVIDKDRWRGQGKIRTWLEKRRLYKEFKRRRYDVLIDFSLRKEYAKWLEGLKIPKRIGFDHQGRGRYLNYRIDLSKEGFAGRHAIEYNSELGKFLGVNVDDKHLEFNIPPEAIKKAEELLAGYNISLDKKIVAVVPGSGSSWGKDAYLKQWPAENFAILLNNISQDTDFDAVVILGSSKESSIAESLKENVTKKAINLCGKTNLSISAALIKRSAFFLGNDGGMVHIAKSLNVPLIAIYGPVDPDVYGPYPKSERSVALFKKGLDCRPCYFGFRYKNNCISNNCLKDFTSEEAYRQIQEKHFLKILVK